MQCAALTLAMLGALACGCTGDGDVKGSSDEAEIQGGRVERGQPAVGLLHFSGGDDFCTGTLIASNVVLTAGHCALDNIDGFYLGVGEEVPYDNDRDWWTTMHRFPVRAAKAHPKYDEFNGCREKVVDVGLVWLEYAVPDVVPVELPKVIAPVVGAECLTVGYGDHSTYSKYFKKTKFGKKRSATVKVTEVTDSRISVTSVTGIPDAGDSGGPLFCEGQLVGVTSCSLDLGQYHSDESFASLRSARAWISKQLAGAH